MIRNLVLPLLVNILIGLYFFWFYPRSVHKHFPDGRLPRGFAILVKVVPAFGAALIVGSLLYGLVQFRGVE